MEPRPEIDVPYLANLARLELTAEETALFRGQLADILNYVAKLSEVDVDETPPDTSMANDLRHDEPRDGFTADEAISNAPRQQNHLFIVPKVVE